MLSKKKVCIVGHFGFGKNLLNGQTIKTKVITKELERQFGEQQIIKIDTHGGKKVIIKTFFKLFLVMKKCRNVIILPAHNGVRFFVPIIKIFNKIFHRRIFYVVIGGWLPDFLRDKDRLSQQLRSFNAIFVETRQLQVLLEKQGFRNIVLMPNCKELEILKEKELIYYHDQPYKLCTFSRVMKEKGIEDAVRAVQEINNKFRRIVYTLDIYGQIDENQFHWFKSLQNNFPEYVKYKGAIDYDSSVEVLKNYFALLFPTHFYTEGIPGTLLDAYAAGVPVIASNWESCKDILTDGECGYVYPFGDLQGLIAILENIALEPNLILQLKNNCIKKSGFYLPRNAILPLSEMLI